MYHFHFYEKDVFIGQGYGLDPDDAIKRWCIKNEFGPDVADGITPVCDLSMSEWDVNIFNCATV